jgi:iron complex outermembrane recepter protein
MGRIGRGMGKTFGAPCVLPLAGLLAVLGSYPTAAADSDKGLDEIIVTATKREESINHVPISIAVINAQEIQALGIQNAEDFSRLVPGLLVEKSCDQCDGLYYNFRGLAGGGSTSLSSAYIDDTPITFGGITPTFNLFDAERVEVLRGPQGTLFGGSAMSGAIRYVMPQPDYKNPSGFARVEYGEIDRGGASSEIEAAGGAPIIEDSLAFRASVFKRQDGGYIDEVSEATRGVVARGINSADSLGGRFVIAGRFGAIEVNASLISQRSHANGLDPYYTSIGEVGHETPLQRFQVNRRVPAYADTNVNLPTLTIKADLGFADLTSITSYLTRHWDVQTDFSFTVEGSLIGSFGTSPDLRMANDQGDYDRAFTQEVRLASKAHDTYEWLIGAYYRHTNENAWQTVAGNILQTYPEIVPYITATPILPGGVVYTGDVTERREQKAVFGEASYKPFDGLKLTGGIRVSDLSHSHEVIANGLFNGGPEDVVRNNDSRNIVTPKVSLSHDFGSSAMTYATYSTGFREGGANPLLPLGRPECVQALASLGLTNSPTTYGSDKVKNFEVGFKGEAEDHRLDYRAAVYYIKWTDLQSSIGLSNGCGFSFTTNLGAARTEGLELESSWTPVSTLRFGLNLGYNSGEYTEDQVIGSTRTGPIYGARKGTPITDFPKWTIAASSQYDFLVTSHWKDFVRVDYQYMSGSSLSNPVSQGAEVNNFQRDAYSFVSLRLGANRGPYELALLVKNLTNTHPLVFGSGYGQGDAAVLESIQPRYIAISALVHF